NNSIHRRFSYENSLIISGKKALILGIMKPNVTFSIYRRQFLLEFDLKFMPGIFHEDSEFQPRAFYYANRVHFINDILYYVTQNPLSITRTPNPKKAFDCIVVANSLSEFSSIVSKDSKFRFDYLISMIINNSLSNTNS